MTTPIVPRIQIVVTGTLNAATLPRWRRLLDDAVAALPAHLVVDLTGCTGVDHVGTALLAGVHERMWALGGRLTLRGMNPRLDQVPPQTPTPAGYRPKHRRGPAAPVPTAARRDVPAAAMHGATLRCNDGDAEPRRHRLQPRLFPTFVDHITALDWLRSDGPDRTVRPTV